MHNARSPPVNMEAQPAVTPNWFCINLGINVANPDVISPSVAPANVININGGILSRRNKAIGRCLRSDNDRFSEDTAIGIDPSSPCICDSRVSRMCRAAEIVNNTWASTSENVPSDMCVQRKFRSACAFAQSDQNHQLAHFGLPRMQIFLHQTAQIADLYLRWAHMSETTFWGRLFKMESNLYSYTKMSLRLLSIWLPLTNGIKPRVCTKSR